MDRVFLDANVLFSAAYTSKSRLHLLWERAAQGHLELLTSEYAFQEAWINLSEAGQRRRLLHLMKQVTLVPNPPLNHPLPEAIQLPDKDRPIFLAALHARATHLLTGDLTHFGPYFGLQVEGIWILPPGAYLSPKD